MSTPVMRAKLRIVEKRWRTRGYINARGINLIMHELDRLRRATNQPVQPEVKVTKRTRPVPFDPDLPIEIEWAGEFWRRCPGCQQPNHPPGTNRWRGNTADLHGGRVHASMNRLVEQGSADISDWSQR